MHFCEECPTGCAVYMFTLGRLLFHTRNVSLYVLCSLVWW